MRQKYFISIMRLSLLILFFISCSNHKEIEKPFIPPSPEEEEVSFVLKIQQINHNSTRGLGSSRELIQGDTRIESLYVCLASIEEPYEIQEVHTFDFNQVHVGSSIVRITPELPTGVYYVFVMANPTPEMIENYGSVGKTLEYRALLELREIWKGADRIQYYPMTNSFRKEDLDKVNELYRIDINQEKRIVTPSLLRVNMDRVFSALSVSNNIIHQGKDIHEQSIALKVSGFAPFNVPKNFYPVARWLSCGVCGHILDTPSSKVTSYDGMLVSLQTYLKIEGDQVVGFQPDAQLWINNKTKLLNEHVGSLFVSNDPNGNVLQSKQRTATGIILQVSPADDINKAFYVTRRREKYYFGWVEDGVPPNSTIYPDGKMYYIYYMKDLSLYLETDKGREQYYVIFRNTHYEIEVRSLNRPGVLLPGIKLKNLSNADEPVNKELEVTTFYDVALNIKDWYDGELNFN